LNLLNMHHSLIEGYLPHQCVLSHLTLVLDKHFIPIFSLHFELFVKYI